MEEEKENEFPERVFDLEDQKVFSTEIQLIDEPYTYENIMNNPLIKPIAETDKSLLDSDNFLWKKLYDIKKDKQWVNEKFLDIAEYSQSPFVARLLKLAQDSSDIIKLKDLQIRNLKSCIREMVQLVKERYGVRTEYEGKRKYAELETVIPEGSYEKYLQKLSNHENKEISEITSKILATYQKDTISKDEKKRYSDAVIEHYRIETNKEKKKLIGSILRLELK